MPVLLYHSISDDPGPQSAPFAVPPAVFARHLELLVAAGYRCLTVSALLDRRPPGRVAVLTFDDGYADFATAALPALQARGLPATLYVTTGWLAGTPDPRPGPSDPMLAWSQLAELVAAEVEIGAHSHSHPELDTLSRAALREELARPKELLEHELGRAMPGLAYPHGYSGPRVRRYARETGYRSGVAVHDRLHRPGGDPLDIARLTVTRATTPAVFAAWLAGADCGSRRPRGPLRSTARAGWRAYRRGRAVLRQRPGSDYA